MDGPNLIIQPAGHNTPQTWENFKHTVLTPVPIKTIRLYVDERLAESLEATYLLGVAHLWGLEPHNKKKVWDRIRVGDSVLFVGDGKVFMSARVAAAPVHSRELALALWGLNKKKGMNTTWEYIYFLDDLHDQNVSYSELSRLLGYSENNNYMSATVRPYQQSKLAFERIGLETGTNLGSESSHKKYNTNFNPLYVADHARAEENYDTQGVFPHEYLEKFASEVSTASMRRNKKKAIEHLVSMAQIQPPEKRAVYFEQIVRNKAFADYVKERADYVCEICGRQPFHKKDGSLYAEADHIEALFLNGKDHPDNMRCLCAQCHRVITYGSEEEISRLMPNPYIK